MSRRVYKTVATCGECLETSLFISEVCAMVRVGMLVFGVNDQKWLQWRWAVGEMLLAVREAASCCWRACAPVNAESGQNMLLAIGTARDNRRKAGCCGMRFLAQTVVGHGRRCPLLSTITKMGHGRRDPNQRPHRWATDAVTHQHVPRAP